MIEDHYLTHVALNLKLCFTTLRIWKCIEQPAPRSWKGKFARAWIFNQPVVTVIGKRRAYYHLTFTIVRRARAVTRPPDKKQVKEKKKKCKSQGSKLRRLNAPVAGVTRPVESEIQINRLDRLGAIIRKKFLIDWLGNVLDRLSRDEMLILSRKMRKLRDI